MSAHSQCLEQLFDLANAPTNPLTKLPGAMAVTEDAPTITAPEFPPQRMRCPHGVRFYAYPNAQLIGALRAMNRYQDPTGTFCEHGHHFQDPDPCPGCWSAA